MAKKEFSIPDCPQLSKYDGMGSAGASMMYHDRVAREGYRPGDYSETVKITTIRNDNLNKTKSDLEIKQAYIQGYKDACRDIGSGYTITDSNYNGNFMLDVDYKKDIMMLYGIKLIK